MKRLHHLIAIPILLAMASCSQPSQDGGSLHNSVDSLMSETDTAESLKLSEDVIDQIIETFPSPLELTSLLHDSGVKFNGTVLNNSDNIDRFENSEEKAFNLGVYGADLGYANFYERPTVALSILSAVRDLSNDLKVGQFFDFSTMKRLAENKNNLDSLLYISTRGFQEMDDYLTSNGRGEISLIMLYGGWLEGLYLATESSRSQAAVPKELADQIGEQKIVIDNLLLLITPHIKNPTIQSVQSDLLKLKELYDKVEISYTYAEPTKKVVDGILVLEDNTSSEVLMDPEVFQEIIVAVAEVRNNKVKL